MSAGTIWQRGLALDLAAVGVIAAIAAICYWVYPSNLALMTRIIAIMLLVLSLDLVTGMAGVATLGHAALFGAGAYGAGIAAAHFGVADPFLLLLIGLIAGAGAGVLSGLVILRGQGLGQLVLSIALVQLAHETASRFSRWTGGSDGLPGIAPAPIFGIWRFDIWGRSSFILGIVLLIAVFLLLRRITRSPFGMLCHAIRQDPVRVRAMGVPLTPVLIRLYAISGAVAGLGGALSAISARVVGLDSLSFTLSAEALVMLVLGGAGNLFGAMIGAAVFVWFEHQVSAINPFHWLSIVGLLLVAVVLFAPRGLSGSVQMLWARLARAGRRAR